MQGVLDSDEDWAKERGAIEQEVAQDLSAPGYKLYERLRAELFAGSPYEHDALGTRPSFDKTTAKMLRDFHAKWYAPNNAILVVVGDLDPKATLAQVAKLFGPIKAKKLPSRPRIADLKPVSPVSFSIDLDDPNATQVVALRMPGLDSPDFPALEVLADVLASHRFDLYELCRGKALAADFSLDPLPKSGLGYAAVTFPSGGDAKAIEAQIRAILAKIAKSGVPAELVEAAKLQERRAAELEKNSIADLASVWSDAIALHWGLHSPDEDLARIEKVTVADVNRVARKYLRMDHAISALLLPQGSGKPVASGGGFGGKETIALGEAKPTQLPEWAQAALSRLAVPDSTLHPVVSTLPNGLTLIVQPETVSGTVSVFGHIRNRPQTEAPPGKDGVDLLLGPLLSFGTEHLDRVAFETALDAIGAQERAGKDFSVQVLSRDFDRGLELLADHELHRLARGGVEPDQAADRAVGRRQDQEPGYLAQRSLIAALYPAGDPSMREATGKASPR